MVPFSQINSLNSSFLQCSGDMVTPSILNAIMCVLDVIFNALLIPRFGVMGAGMGTALACACVSLTMTARCCIHNEKLHLRRTEGFHYNPEILKRAFRIGTPVAVQEIAINSAMVVATMIIAPLGAVSIAANSFAVTAESLCYMPGYGIGSAATTLVGRSVGAGETKQAKRYGNICTAMGACFMAATGAIMMLICPIVFRVLTPDHPYGRWRHRYFVSNFWRNHCLEHLSWQQEHFVAQVILCSKPYESWKYLDRPAGSGNDSCKKSGALRYVDAMAVELCVRAV